MNFPGAHDDHDWQLVHLIYDGWMREGTSAVTPWYLPSATVVAERIYMFYRCLSVHDGGGRCTPPRQTPSWAAPLGRHPLGRQPPPADPAWADTLPGQTPPRQTPLPSRHSLPGQTPPPPRDGHCSGRYASYWNAFLFNTSGLNTKNTR